MTPLEIGLLIAALWLGSLAVAWCFGARWQEDQTREAITRINRRCDEEMWGEADFDKSLKLLRGEAE